MRPSRGATKAKEEEATSPTPAPSTADKKDLEEKATEVEKKDSEGEKKAEEEKVTTANSVLYWDQFFWP